MLAIENHAERVLGYLVKDKGKVSRRKIMTKCGLNGTHYRSAIDALLDDDWLEENKGAVSGQSGYVKSPKLLSYQ